MKVSLNWLKEHVDITLSPEALSHLLTMAGLEVEGIETVGEGLSDVVAARILKVLPHPNADRLMLCHVDAGAGETLEVVCGAPNVSENMVAPFIGPGGVLPGGHKMKETRVRGQLSRGMLLAEDEMGLTDDHTGIMVLPEDTAPGTPICDVGLFPDWVYDISITPNRPDCASVRGIAREIAANTGMPLKEIMAEVNPEGPPVDTLSRVTVHDPYGCPRYAAAVVRDISLGSSPFWMRYRLHQSGVRSISNVVDVTNYVMLELGQPLHAFDYDRLHENRIAVRRAVQGEPFTTLDGVTRELNSEILLICDGEKSVALAGIMGGLNSEIEAGTRNLLLESAFFDPITIRRGSKGLGLSTEASYRFERGADVEGVINAIHRSVYLINLLAGGKTAKGIIDNYSKPRQAPEVVFRPPKANAILGTDIPAQTMKQYLADLGMTVKSGSSFNEMHVSPPSFRMDIEREVDLVEEVARLHGFDNIPVMAPRIIPSNLPKSMDLVLRDKARTLMSGLGFSEIITYSFVSPDSVDPLEDNEKSGGLKAFTRIVNPLTTDQSVLRTSLIPGLLETARNNMVHEMDDLRLFEWGKVFFKNERSPQPNEMLQLAGIMTGMYVRKAWYTPERPVDFYDVKGSLEVFLKGLGLTDFSFQKAGPHPGYDPDISCGIYCGDSIIGHLGQAAPGLVQACELTRKNIWLFEIDVSALLLVVPEQRAFRPFGRFPAVLRDISLVLNRRIESRDVVQVIHQEGKELVESVRIFDLYEGDRIDAFEKALSLRIRYRSHKETLDGEKINRLHERIISKIRKKTGGRLREG